MVWLAYKRVAPGQARLGVCRVVSGLGRPIGYQWSGLWYLKNHAIYLKVIRCTVKKLPCYLHKIFKLMFLKQNALVKFTVMFVHELLDLMCLYYHVIETKVIGYVSSTTFTGSKKLPSVGMWVISYVVYILSLYLHMVTRLFFDNFLSRVEKLSCEGYVSYDLCWVYLIMLCTHMLPRVCLSTKFIRGKNLPWCLYASYHPS